MNPGIVDLCAGPGGWSEGLRMLGLAEVGLEWDAAACATRAAAGHLTIRCDIAAYPVEPLVGKVTGLIASPPCQAWSRAGKRLGLVDQPLVHHAVADLAAGRDTRAELLVRCADPRSLLAAEPMRYLHAIRPEWTAMEEVPDVLPLFRQYAEILRGWGYSVWAGELNAADYGVPQTRKRAILIASRVRKVAPPLPTHAKVATEPGLFGGPGRARWVSMAEALGWGATDRPVPTVTAGGGKTGGAEPFPTQARAALESSRDRGDWVLRSRRDSDAWLASDGPRENRPVTSPAPTFTGEAHRWNWALRNGTQKNAAIRKLDEPAGTLFFGARCNDVSWVHEEADSVRITVAEAAVLQSFRADYPWQGTKTKQFECIGNAVPPLLAAHVVAAATGLSVPAVTEGVAA